MRLELVERLGERLVRFADGPLPQGCWNLLEGDVLRVGAVVLHAVELLPDVVRLVARCVGVDDVVAFG